MLKDLKLLTILLLMLPGMFFGSCVGFLWISLYWGYNRGLSIANYLADEWERILNDA